MRALHSAALWQKNCKICDLRLPKSQFCGYGIIEIAKLLFILLQTLLLQDPSFNCFYLKRIYIYNS